MQPWSTSTSATPPTGQGSVMSFYYREAVEIDLRASGVDVVINLTAGMGGDLVLGGPEQPLPYLSRPVPMAGAAERLAHVEELRPEMPPLRLQHHELRGGRRLHHGRRARRTWCGRSPRRHQRPAASGPRSRSSTAGTW